MNKQVARMPTPAPGLEDWEFLEPVSALIDLHEGDGAAQLFWKNIGTCALGMELIELAPFCAAAPPAVLDFVDADFEDDTWKGKAMAYARRWFYSQVCVD